MVSCSAPMTRMGDVDAGQVGAAVPVLRHAELVADFSPDRLTGRRDCEIKV